ncbi:acetate--CoA ligase family protein [Mesorhizobium sp. CGMCC 1.15528]|uniref:Acetate--CoA ligase family protein n=1 Tax=Mesorhizobium zhangyense TaxID=1776730 RepID=A0A7C9V948_9HYPH|nr:acetate--CoA ligase family protein [Mesorhizobium zhangyense]NGN41706.1 acetate--CoA ligase family protein [Mesorhizobium zhangyense]
MKHVTPSAGLDALFRPSSVAILGASDDPTRISGRPLRYLLEGGFKGGIFPVNPNRETVQGVKAYKSLADVPAVPDVALLAVPASLTEQAVRDCIAKGIKGAVIFSAGYAESGEEGLEVQKRIADIARAGGLRLLGPNCLGIFNPQIGFFGTFTQSLDREMPGPGPLGIISQSGAYGSHIAYLARKRGIGINYWITTGNEADIDVAESLEWMAVQPDIKVIMAYVEGVRDGPRFRNALELARRNRKPVVMMKVGRSEIGAKAASSHTASLAGADAIYDAVFAQYGVHRATTTEEQIDVAYACARGVFPKSNKLGVVTLSGGAGVLISDAAERYGLDVAPMPATAQKKLKDLLPFASVENPVDTTAQALNDMNLLARNIEVILDEGGYDAVIGFFSSVPNTRTLSGPLRDAIAKGCSRFPDRLIALSMIGDPEVVAAYEASGFLVFEDSDRAVAALAALVGFSAAFDRSDDAPSIQPAASIGTEALSESAAKALLGAAGIPFLDERVAASAAQAGADADAIGYPVVLKIVSPDIEHKTEIGGVMVGVADRAGVEAGFETLMARAAEHRPDARIEGVLIAPMARKGVETIIGVSRDPVFGPVVMFGIGGVHVEVLKDVVFRLAPFGRAEAVRMIDSIRGRALLSGVRGSAPADVDALADVLVRISEFAAAHHDDIETIDLNPVVVLAVGEGVVALDALVVPRRDLN